MLTKKNESELEEPLEITSSQARALIDACDREDCEESLIEFVRHFWHVVEPGRSLVEGRVLDELCRHLEAVYNGEIRNLLVNIPPGAMKSLLTCVFFPAWVWTRRPSVRFLCFSYSASLTERDNFRFLNIVTSEKYKRLWGDVVKIKKTGVEKIVNESTGWKLASSVGGTGTGERADFLIVDDAHNVKEQDSDAVRKSTLQWWTEVVPTRLNDYEKSSKIVIMQRVYQDDLSGDILSRGLPFVHLMLPMRYDPDRHCDTPIGGDWRTERGELLWPERFSARAVDEIEATMGPFATAAQHAQSPTPRGGGIIKEEDWQLWDEVAASRMGLQSPNQKLTYPTMEFVVTSIDTAYSSKEESDYSACVTFGLWKNEHMVPKIMLLDCWKDRLDIHGKMPDRFDEETDEEYLARNKRSWGLVERVQHTCKRFKSDVLLIENKASGKSVAQELARLFRDNDFGVHLVDPKGDKVARVYKIQHLFSGGVIYAPDREWAQSLIDDFSVFPKGKHDDTVDSATMALIWLRDSGWALRSREADQLLNEEFSIEAARERKPLYNI